MILFNWSLFKLNKFFESGNLFNKFNLKLNVINYLLKNKIDVNRIASQYKLKTNTLIVCFLVTLVLF